MGIMKPAFNQTDLQSSWTKFQVPVWNGSYLHWGGGMAPCSSVLLQAGFTVQKSQTEKCSAIQALPHQSPPPKEMYVKSKLNNPAF